MERDIGGANRRVLVIDDNPADTLRMRLASGPRGAPQLTLVRKLQQ